MKTLFKTLAVGVAIGALLAGCSSATSSNDTPPADFSTASQADTATGVVGLGAFGTAFSSALIGGEVPPSITVDSSGAPTSYVVTLTSYDNGQGSIVSGTFTISSSVNESGTGTITMAASLTVTGTGAGTMTFNITSAMSSFTPTTLSGTFTINGHNYSFSQTNPT